MAERRRVPIPFGQGLDRETGQMVVQAGSMELLQNVFMRNGKYQVRKGTEEKLNFVDANGDDHTHILAGHMLLGERTGVVVAYQGGAGAAQEGDVDIYLIDSSATTQRRLGNWFNTNDLDLPLEPPTVHIATSYGRAFFAHDELAFFKRAATFVYDPYESPGLGPIRGDFDDRTAIWERIDAGDVDEATLNNLKFRGVASHRNYLFGWGYGTESEDRAEIVRVSLPGQPTKFDPEDYFKIGSQRDPTIACISLGDDLIAFKETETYRIFGHSRKTFGHELIDERFGCLGPRLAVSVAGSGFFWSTEGPRLTQGGPSQELAIPLELDGPEPSALATMIEEPGLGWANYIPEERVVVFAFNRRLYVLSVRDRPWTWSYWKLGFDQQCGFQLYDTGIGGAATGVPTGYPSFARDDFDVPERGSNELWPIWSNIDPSGSERVEIWYRRGENLVNFWRLLDDGDADGVVDGFTSGSDAAVTASFSTFEHFAPSADDLQDPRDVQRIEITASSGAGHAWIEQTVVDIEAGSDYDIGVDILQGDVVGTVEAQVFGRWLDAGDVELATFSQALPETLPGDDGFVRRFVPTQTAPANAAKLELHLRTSALAGGDIGRTDFRNLAVVPASTWSAWDQLAVDVDLQASFQDQRVAVSLEEGLGGYYQMALRYTNSGLVFTAGYEGEDPTAWPDVSRGAAFISSAPETLDIMCGFWYRGTNSGQVVGINELLVRMSRETYDRIIGFNNTQAFQEAGVRLYRKDSTTGGSFVCVRDDNPEDFFGREPTLETVDWPAPCEQPLVDSPSYAWAEIGDISVDDVAEEEVEYAVAVYFGKLTAGADPFAPSRHCAGALEVSPLSGSLSKWAGPRKPSDLVVSASSPTEYNAEWVNEYEQWGLVWQSRDVTLETEVHAQINGGGFSVVATVDYTADPDAPANSRATALSATTGDTVDVKVRHKVSSFGLTDFSDFTETFTITMP